MAASPALSVIICTYNRASYLRHTLQSLLDATADPARFEVLVIDNNSADDTAAVVKDIADAYPRNAIHYHHEPQQGLSHARNRGIRASQAPVLLFVDDDVHVPDGYLQAWLRFFDRNPGAAGGGGRIRVQFDDPRPAWMSHFLLPLLGHHDLGKRQKPYPARKYPFGGNMAFRRTVFDTYGVFNTELGRKGGQLMASEEKEFYGRLPAGVTICYLPDALLYHRVGHERLNESYIRKQAEGLGRSIALQLREGGLWAKAGELAGQFIKSLATVVLCIGYSLMLQFGKAGMLIKFRRWIWEGYRSASSAS